MELWQVDQAPTGVVVHAALALVYCPLTLSPAAWALLAARAPGRAAQVAVVGRLLRQLRDERGAIPLGGVAVAEDQVAAALDSGR
ncbi:MAG: hypothetical protein M0Z54_09800 [Thermaerobacter sp.]|nr:hypothetical protein [Thermaerobacter sp.]